MKSDPWFSSQKKEDRYEHQETVHHDNTLCVEGENITKKYLRSGTDRRPLCKQCASLDALDK